MPGAGKTRVGEAVARLLGWGFIDVDQIVSEDVGDVPAFIERVGVPEFRARERAVIASMAPRNCVVSVGGGAVIDPSNRARLAELGPVVWLRATLPTLIDRVGSGDDRPLLKGDPANKLEALLAERTPIYEELATVVVDVDGRDANENAGEVVKALSA